MPRAPRKGYQSRQGPEDHSKGPSHVRPLVSGGPFGPTPLDVSQPPSIPASIGPSNPAHMNPPRYPEPFQQGTFPNVDALRPPSSTYPRPARRTRASWFRWLLLVQCHLEDPASAKFAAARSTQHLCCPLTRVMISGNLCRPTGQFLVHSGSLAYGLQATNPFPVDTN